MALLILFFTLSIVFSFLCSVLEAVLLSVTPSYVKRNVQENTLTGKLLEQYKEDIDRPLSAILTLNTIAHTVGAIGVGAQAGKIFGSTYLDLGFTQMSYESLIAGAMTLAILILSEIIPKTLGANNWQALTPFTVRTLRVLMWVLFPFVWLSQLMTRTLKKDKERSVLSRADFSAMAQVGEESGALDRSESAIIKNLMDFQVLTVRDIMTPKSVITMSHEDVTLKDFYDSHKTLQFSRIPIYRENRDDIVGMVLKDDLYEELAKDKFSLQMKELKRPVSTIFDTAPLPQLFKHLTQRREHMVIVIDEFDAVVGLVTMEDLFETLLGEEIVDESDEIENMQNLAKIRAKERRRKRGRTEEREDEGKEG